MITTKEITAALSKISNKWKNKKWNLEDLCSHPIESTYYSCWIDTSGTSSWRHQICLCLDTNMNLIVSIAKYTGRKRIESKVTSTEFSYKKAMLSSCQVHLGLKCILDIIGKLFEYN